MKCPKCGADAAGKFCGECGTALAGAACRSCSAALAAGANFCTQCGTRVQAATSSIPWVVGVFLTVALLGLIWAIKQNATPDPQAQAAGPPTPLGSPPPLSGDMRENADRLFNRIMSTREQGDTAGARQFLPMAITAYQNSDLDADGFYHLSILQSLALAPDDAMASAQKILDDDPTHLLGLHAAAMAARAGNEREKARQFYQKLLDEFEVETAKTRPEYTDHAQLITAVRQEAKEYVGR